MCAQELEVQLRHALSDVARYCTEVATILYWTIEAPVPLTAYQVILLLSSVTADDVGEDQKRMLNYGKVPDGRTVCVQDSNEELLLVSVHVICIRCSLLFARLYLRFFDLRISNSSKICASRTTNGLFLASRIDGKWLCLDSQRE